MKGGVCVLKTVRVGERLRGERVWCKREFPFGAGGGKSRVSL